MKRMLLGALLFSSLMGSDLMAQAGLTIGDSIFLTYKEVDGRPPISVTGAFYGLSNDSLTVVSGHETNTLRIPLYLVDGLRYHRTGHHGGGFAMLGAVLGGVLGGIDASKQPNCGNSCLILSDQEAMMASVIGGAIGGGFMGYILGSLWETQRWVDVPVHEVARWSLTPTVRNGVGLSARIRTN